MNKYNKVVTLPDRDKMLKRLIEAVDESSLKNGFYPILLEYAGAEKTIDGVVILLQLAMFQCAGDTPLYKALELRIAEFIDAIVENSEAAQLAKDFFAEASAR